MKCVWLKQKCKVIVWSHSHDCSEVLITVWFTTYYIYMVALKRDWLFKTYLLQCSYILEICDLNIILGNVCSLICHKIKLVEWILKWKHTSFFLSQKTFILLILNVQFSIVLCVKLKPHRHFPVFSYRFISVFLIQLTLHKEL